MKAFVVRKQKYPRAKYVLEGTEWSAESRLTFDIALQSIAIFKKGKARFVLKERFFPLKLINFAVKILDFLIPFSCYSLADTGIPVLCGKLRTKAFCAVYEGKLNGTEYELREHSANTCSLMKNGVQIAKFKKSTRTEFEENQYEVSYQNEDDLEVCFLFCVLADACWFKDDASMAAIRYEWNYIPFDKYPERARWEPSLAEEN